MGNVKIVESTSYDSFVGVVRCPNGDMLAVFRRGTSHSVASSGQGLYRVRSTDGGATWGTASQIVSNSDGNERVTATLSVIGTTVYLTTWTRPLSGSATGDRVRIYTSIDNGATWSGPSTVGTDFGYVSYSESPVRFFDGYYYLGMYGQETATTGDFSAAVFRSSDLSTWTRVVTWDTGGTNGYNESAVVGIGSTLVALVRRESDASLYTSTSTDGTTWSTITKARAYAQSAPRTSGDLNGRAYLFLRWTTGGGSAISGGYLATVDDTGAVVEVEPIYDTNAYEYGQLDLNSDGDLVGVWATGLSLGDADIYAATWTISDPNVAGTIEATLPAVTGSLTGFVTALGTLAATLPAVTGDLLGIVDANQGTIEATLPAVTGSLSGVVTTLGTIGGTLSAVTGDLTGDTGAPPTTGTIEAVLPALTGELYGASPYDAPGGWTTELTGRALVGIDTTTTDLYVPPAPAAIPGPVTPQMLHRNSQVMDPPSAATPVIADTDVTVITEELGIARVWVDGVDRTYSDDGELLDLDDLASSVGLGDLSATATVKGFQVWNADGDGEFDWLYPGAHVEAGMVHPVTGARTTWWAGTLLNPSGDLSGSSFQKKWEAAGPLTQLARANMQPLDSMPPTDIGIVIPRVVNQVISRDYPPMPQVRTGITTTKRGTYGQKVAEYVREVLATAWVGNRQWRPARDPANPRQYRLVLTDTTTVHWTLTAGAIGVKPQLGRDWSQNENAIYGRGTLTGGHRWMNRKYPYLLPYDPPEYFNVDPDAALSLGSTDADTRNNGVSLLQRRLQELGYKVTVTGVYDTQTRAAVIRLQRKRGLLIDGITAGQTWTSVWSIGATGADLRSVRLPLATDPRVEPWLYLPNGAIAAPNPDYVPSWPRVEVDLDYGENTTLELGIDDALQRVDRALTAPLMGTITLTTCPWEGSRWEMQQGHNVLLKGWEGADVLLHIVEVKRNRRAGTVTLTVDEAFRDALTVHEVMVRNAESRPDPARRPGVIGRTRSTSAPDMTTPFDGESPAGKLPELTLRANLWSVWPLAIDQVGTLARVWMRTSLPACRFAVLLFGQEVLPSQLHAHVGLVLSQDRPWASETVDAWLEAHGFIDGWGHSGEACGYQPGSQAKGDPVTGKFEVRNPVSYVSVKPPFVWVGMLAAANCRIVGEFDPKPVT